MRQKTGMILALLMTVGACGSLVILPGETTPPTPAPTVSLSASPTSVDSGNDTTLTWTTTDADSCTASDDWTGSKAAGGGSEVVGPITVNSTFTLTCSNVTGSDQDSASVTVSSPPPFTASGEWVEVQNTALRPLDPCPDNTCSYHAGTNNQFESITLSWSGGAYDSIQNRLITWGAGHSGGFINSAYAQGLSDGERSQLVEPSTNLGTEAAANSSGVYADGRPVARHTYSHVQFIPSLNQFRGFSTYGASFDGFGEGRSWYLDFDDVNLDWAEGTSVPGGSLVLGYTAFNTATNKGYVHRQNSGSPMYEWDPVGDTYTQVTGSIFSTAGYSTAAIDTSRNGMLVLGGTFAQARYVTLNSNLSLITTENLLNNSTFTGSLGNTLANDNSFGLDYDPVNDVFVAWISGKSLYLIDPETFEVTLYTPATGPTPPAPEPLGTFGRFRYAPDCACFVVGNTVDDNLFKIKLVLNAEADWLARSTAPGVVMATNFDQESDVTNWTQLDGQENQVTWETGTKVSGAGSLRFDVLKTDGSGSGQWRGWLRDDQAGFTDGDTFYVSYSQYNPTYHVEYPFAVSSGAGGWKSSIISKNAGVMNGVNQDCVTQECGSNQINELVPGNYQYQGIIRGYNRNTNGAFPGWQVGAATACSGADFIYQNAVDRPGPHTGTACEQDEKRLGGLYSQGTGSPFPLNETGAKPWARDGWTKIYLEVTLNNQGSETESSSIKMYAAHEGESVWDLLVDRNIDLGAGPVHNTIWLLPYITNRLAEPGRQDTYTLYDEVIVSTQPIAAPIF